MAYAVVLKGILMELEHDKYGNAYEVEMLKNLHKVCPLTGYRAEHFDCDYKDCSKITPDKYDLLYNQRYHCEVERRNIQLEFERRLQRYMDSIRADERRSKSLEVAKTINVNQFYEFCDDLEQYMKQNRQAYTQNLIIYPYHEQDTIFLVFWYDNIEIDLKKSAKWKAIEAAFSKAGSSVNLEKRNESELAKLIVSSAKKRNCTIDMNNARYLISVVGSDIQTIFNELEKICAFAD